MSCVVCGRCACGAADAFGVNVDNIGTKLAVSSFKREVAAEGRIAELERAAETSRAEHAAALGLATARIRELEGERDELLGLLRRWTTVPGAFLTPRAHFDLPGDYGGCLCPLHQARAIVARIEKATKGTT